MSFLLSALELTLKTIAQVMSVLALIQAVGQKAMTAALKDNVQMMVRQDLAVLIMINIFNQKMISHQTVKFYQVSRNLLCMSEL